MTSKGLRSDALSNYCNDDARAELETCTKTFIGYSYC